MVCTVRIADGVPTQSGFQANMELNVFGHSLWPIVVVTFLVLPQCVVGSLYGVLSYLDFQKGELFRYSS